MTDYQCLKDTGFTLDGALITVCDDSNNIRTATLTMGAASHIHFILDLIESNGQTERHRLAAETVMMTAFAFWED